MAPIGLNEHHDMHLCPCFVHVGIFWYLLLLFGTFSCNFWGIQIKKVVVPDIFTFEFLFGKSDQVFLEGHFGGYFLGVFYNTTTISNAC